ncbi:MAG: ORF6N domain-containing protein [Pigmentiphaga sp.]|nr:ORF6N domain-containing protein [Pigmentiphaga sp.]
MIKQEKIERKIHIIRNTPVMLDSDLAQLYQVETKTLNQAVKRNSERFPKHFMFQLTAEEWELIRVQNTNILLRSQNVTLKNQRGIHRKYLPYVFAEQGVAMLSAILRSNTAVQISIQIMNAFVQIRSLIAFDKTQNLRISQVETKLIEHDKQFNRIFSALENKTLSDNGIFFDGQIFDAYVFFTDLVKSAKKEIILIDNYIDESVLIILSKRRINVSVRIYTKVINEQLKLDLLKHNSQYPEITIIPFYSSHDRFMIIDQKDLYHIGASLKDLGKKWFAFSKLNWDVGDVIRRIGVADH